MGGAQGGLGGTSGRVIPFGEQVSTRVSLVKRSTMQKKRKHKQCIGIKNI